MQWITPECKLKGHLSRNNTLSTVERIIETASKQRKLDDLRLLFWTLPLVGLFEVTVSTQTRSTLQEI